MAREDAGYIALAYGIDNGEFGKSALRVPGESPAALLRQLNDIFVMLEAWRA